MRQLGKVDLHKQVDLRGRAWNAVRGKELEPALGVGPPGLLVAPQLGEKKKAEPQEVVLRQQEVAPLSDQLLVKVRR